MLNKEQQKWIAVAETLTFREFSILILRYSCNETYEKIGKTYGLTNERVRQIEATALRKISLHSKIK